MPGWNWFPTARSRPEPPIRWNAYSTLRIWRRFWNCSASSTAALSLIQKHSHPCNLPDHVDLPSRIPARLLVGGRMRLYQDLAIVRRTPTATIAVPMFQEINRTIDFVGPAIDCNSTLGIVD